MNQSEYQSHLAAIDAGKVAHIAIFRRSTHIWRLAQAILEEHEPRFEEAGFNRDTLDSLCEDTIFAYSDRYPSSIDLDNASRHAILTLRQPYGEHWSDSIGFPRELLTMTDAELHTHFRSMLNGWLKNAQDKQFTQEREQEAERRA